MNGHKNDALVRAICIPSRRDLPSWLYDNHQNKILNTLSVRDGWVH